MKKLERATCSRQYSLGLASSLPKNSIANRSAGSTFKNRIIFFRIELRSIDVELKKTRNGLFEIGIQHSTYMVRSNTSIVRTSRSSLYIGFPVSVGGATERDMIN